jgi:ribosomal protein S18
MTRREKQCEIDVLKNKYIYESDYKNTRILRLYFKREILSDRKLNNLLKQFRLIKVFSEA